MEPRAPEHDWIARAVQGDAVATTLLLKQSRRRICSIIALRIPPDVRGHVDADDVVQEAHVEVFRHVTSFVPQHAGSFDKWVIRIALRKLREAVRRQRAQRRGGGMAAVGGGEGRSMQDSMVMLLDLVAAPGQHTPSRVAARVEGVQAVQDALDRLPEHYRDAVRIVYLEGQPVQHAARLMHRTERAVHGLCRRGIKLMRDEMGQASRFLSSTS